MRLLPLPVFELKVPSAKAPFPLLPAQHGVRLQNISIMTNDVVDNTT